VIAIRGKEFWTFAKYCIVGASSFLVGLVTFNISWLILHNFLVCNALAYILSLTNGFCLNRGWTFKDKRDCSVWEQATKFAAVNIVGWAINTSIIALLVAMAMSVHVHAHFASRVGSIFADLIAGHAKRHYSLLLLNAAGVLATGIVLIWNYIGNRHWSFKR
jgi:putative flippase GtrA